MSLVILGVGSSISSGGKCILLIYFIKKIVAIKHDQRHKFTSLISLLSI